jgi:2-oxoglutarate dehydrogenase E2 component (dihydrolipoamide succinyltransferase)
MAFEIKVPNAGESITSAVISTWHKKTGDSVQPGDLLVTIDTDKVSTELQSEAAGILEITAQAGPELAAGRPLRRRRCLLRQGRLSRRSAKRHLWRHRLPQWPRLR